MQTRARKNNAAPSILRVSALAATALVLGVGAAFLTACSGDDDGNGASDTPTFTDDPTPIEGVSTIAQFPVVIPRSDGKTLTLNAVPTRIVSMSPGATEIIYAIGAESALIAVDTESDFPTQVATLSARIPPGPDAAAQIAALNPDLVIINQDQGGLVAALDQRNLPVYYQDANTALTTVEQVFGQIALIGKATGKNDEASALVATLGARVQTITGAVQGINSTTSPRVFHELSTDLRTASEGSLPGDLYRILRARNIAGDGGGAPYPQMTEQAVVASAPDVIIIAHPDTTAASVAARPGWNTVPAVTEDAITTVDPDAAIRPGPRIVDTLEAIAKAVYPERFQ